ncbi:MAG TPA: phage holin family protein [Candidatus Dormibacteraeota bacterium]
MAASPRASATDSARATSTNGHRGVIELARLAVEDTIRLVQQEIQLAKIEIQEMLKSNIKAAIFLAVAGVCALFFFVMLLVFIALLIPAHALVAGIEAVIFLILGVVFGLVGKSMLKTKPLPKTMTTLKEDAEWAKQVLKRNGK